MVQASTFLGFIKTATIFSWVSWLRSVDENLTGALMTSSSRTRVGMEKLGFRSATRTIRRPRLISISAFLDRKSTRLNSSHVAISYAVFCLKKKINKSDLQTNHKLPPHNEWNLARLLMDH